MIEILNLGAGVQSTTLLLMAIKGELPKPDHVFFADTGWEPQEVYTHLEWLEGEMARAGLVFHKVQAGNIKTDALISQIRGRKVDGVRWASMPYFVLNQDGSIGMVRRQCTAEYKIQPIQKAIKKDVLGIRPKAHWPKEVCVRRWYGISLDEVQRMRKSADKWSVNWYPLVEKRMRRNDCLQWLSDNGYSKPPRSACIGCPFHSDKEWVHLKETDPVAFEDACAFDDQVRDCGGFRGKVFLHRSCVPLRDVVFAKKTVLGVLENTWDDECAGICGV